MIRTSLGGNHCISSGPVAVRITAKPTPKLRREASNVGKFVAHDDKTSSPIRSQADPKTRLSPILPITAPPGTLEETFGKTGFKDVETRMAREPLRMASAAECLRWRRESSGTLQQMLTGLSETSRRGVWNEIELEFKKFEGPDSFESPCELIVASGAK